MVDIMGGAAQGASAGSVLGPWGSLAGGAIGAGLGFVPGLKKESPQKVKKHMLQAVDPNYYDTSRIRYGMMLGALQNWGIPSGADYYNGMHSNFKGRDENLLDYFGGDWKSKIRPGQDENEQKARLAKRTYQKLAGDKMPAMQSMFGIPSGNRNMTGNPAYMLPQQAPMQGQGFGAGNGNMGGFTGGYGGPLPTEHFNGTLYRPTQAAPRLMPGG